MINYLLKTYVTNNAITEMEEELLHFTQSSNMTPAAYAEALWSQALCCHVIYYKYVLKGLFVEGLHRSISHSKHFYFSSRKSAIAHDLARHASIAEKLAARVVVNEQFVLYRYTELPPWKCE